jgi:hypothetical protein
MNNEKALMLTTKRCLIAFFNKLYENSGDLALLDCIAAARRLPCSNCLPRFIGPLAFAPSPLPIGFPPLAAFASVDRPLSSASTSSAAPRTNRKLTKIMRVAAEAELRLFRERVHKSERDRTSHGYTPPSSYFPNPAIVSVLDHFLTISTVERIMMILPKWKHHARHGASLLELIKRLQAKFELEFETVRLEKNAANRAKAKAKCRVDESDEDMPEDEEDNNPADEPPIAVLAADPLVTLPRKCRPLEDTTNDEPKAKRTRTPAAPLLAAAVVAQSYRLQYTMRARKPLNQENILQ